MFFALVAVVVIAPFEWTLITLPGPVTLTSVEAVLGMALIAYGFTLAGERRTPRAAMPSPVTVAVVAFLSVLALAAVVTDFERGNALRFVARMVTAAALGAMAFHTIHTPRRARTVAAVMVAVASVVALVAVLETMQVASVMKALTVFRPGFHVVAGQLRATSTLLYPTVASMYLEVAFVVGLWLLLTTTTMMRAVVFVALVVIGAGISATFTRAGLIAMAVAILLVATIPGRVGKPIGSRDRSPHGVLTALSLALVAVVLLAHSPELLAARLTTEGSDAWYGARYDTPATLDMSTGGVRQIPVTITNTGRLTWDSQTQPAFALSYHWLRADDARRDVVVEFEGHRTPFASAVKPGEKAHLIADVIAPAMPGTYTLVWDVVHETRAWLSTEGVTAARTRVVVTGEPQTAPEAPRMRHLPAATIRPTRPALWSAAFQIARGNPWLGIGPDNYRLAYGPHLGSRQWDPRVHANSMYLEALTGAGVFGLLALLWLLGALTSTLWWRARRADAACLAGPTAAIALLVVIAGHGLVDSFLGFTTTYATFGVSAGWALSPGLMEGAPRANRV